MMHFLFEAIGPGLGLFLMGVSLLVMILGAVFADSFPNDATAAGMAVVFAIVGSIGYASLNYHHQMQKQAVEQVIK